MEANDFDFESDYDPQDDGPSNDMPAFESGTSDEAEIELGMDDFGAELDSFSAPDVGLKELHDINPDDNDLDDLDVSVARTKWKKHKKKRSPRFIGLVSLTVGVVLGIVYGYFINPVVWVDAGIPQLRTELQEDYVRAVIDSYELNDDKERALLRLYEVGFERSSEFLALIAANPGSQDIGKIQQLSALVSSDFGAGQLPEGSVGIQAPIEEGGLTSQAGGVSPLILFSIVATLVLVLVTIIMFVRKRAKSKPSTEDGLKFVDGQEYSGQAPQANYAMGSDNPPISQWMTTYLIGDDLFDDSFSIDTPSGEFMGECGVGIADTIGVGDPKRVGAFEIWLFDKNDIQTVTKVLMSEHAFSDDAISAKLSAKGDPEMALTGHEIVMETATLQLIARIVDMTYGVGSMPDNSFFERMTIELAVWQK